MSTSTTIDIWCDNGECCNWVNGASTVKDARKEAHTQGWVSTKSGNVIKDYCPQCAKEKRLQKCKK